MKFLVLVAAGLLWSGAAGAAEGEPDTTRTLLDSIREADKEFFSDEVLDANLALRDSAMSALDSLGFEELEAQGARAAKTQLVLGPAGRLMTYNRVEGLVAGIELGLERGGGKVTGQIAYATAPKQMRHLEYGLFPFSSPLGAATVELGYADRVVPYGSNRPTANWLRALVGSADEQDYMQSEGGWASLRLSPGIIWSVSLGYEAAEERSVAARTTFAFFGPDDLMEFNAPIDPGTDRAAIAGLAVGRTEDSRQWVELRHRVAGGGLGGDFTYSRFDVEGEARRFVLGGWEIHARGAGAFLGGSAPVQRLADVGGLSTVRGFDRRSAVGASSVAGRLELWLPYDPLRATGVRYVRDLKLQLVGWGDAGRVWEGNTEEVLGSAGIGVQRYLGPFGRGANLRFDVAFPIGPEREDDTVLYLHFTPGYF